MIVADTSFLFSLYGDDAHSPAAIAWVKKQKHSIAITSLTEFELANAFRFARFRNVISEEDANLYWQHFLKDQAAGLVSLQRANLANIIETARKLSEQFTPRHGHRSFDILQVAGAIELKAKTFLTFDRNQEALAKAQDFAVPVSS